MYRLYWTSLYRVYTLSNYECNYSNKYIQNFQIWRNIGIERRFHVQIRQKKTNEDKRISDPKYFCFCSESNPTRRKTERNEQRGELGERQIAHALIHLLRVFMWCRAAAGSVMDGEGDDR